MKKIVGVIFLAAFALVGCSTTTTHKSEGKLCTGTKRAYTVGGIEYQPQEHYEYEETGVASWYGPRFHGRPKSCGEIFDMHGISAAHKTLPIPSVVRVTNVKNGTSVKLLVDDRGPFVDNRIIDLSKGAAVYLGIHDRGLGTVCVECLPEESKAFARFVSKYGRYGRDPNGRTWETIFRDHFDHEDSAALPKPFGSLQLHRVQRIRKRPSLEPIVRSQPFRRPRTKPIPVSRPESEEDIQREIDELLKDTRAYMRRKQV